MALSISGFSDWILLGIWSLRTMKIEGLAIAFLAISSALIAEELPRKARINESYPNTDVIYDSVTAPNGNRLRTIITKPHAAKAKLPVIFVAGWLSCDSVEAPAGTKEATGIVFQGLAQMSGFSLFRLDKQGVGDSEGTCGENDFQSELGGYRAAFRALQKYDFINPEQVYILGISNGGGFAPLVPESDAEKVCVRGYVSVGGWLKTWFEHMLEIERRRFGLMGKSPGNVSERMKRAATLYHDWLIKGRPVDQIIRDEPELAELWPEGADHAHLYGRPLAFYQQLQSLNLAEAWSQVKVPVLILHGQFDWIMSREDPELMAQYVNANRPGVARFVEVPSMGHTFQHYLSLADAFRGKSAPFDPKVSRLVTDWFEEQRLNTRK
jgi:pimeloyl-ACP methyl ester carboxylesterase